MQEKRSSGPWRQDDLEPRIVLDANSEFFAIGISGAAAETIVGSLNRTEADGVRATMPALEARRRPTGREPGH